MNLFHSYELKIVQNTKKQLVSKKSVPFQTYRFPQNISIFRFVYSITVPCIVLYRREKSAYRIPLADGETGLGTFWPIERNGVLSVVTDSNDRFCGRWQW